MSLLLGRDCYDSFCLLIKIVIFQNVRHWDHFSKAHCYFLLTLPVRPYLELPKGKKAPADWAAGPSPESSRRWRSVCRKGGMWSCHLSASHSCADGFYSPPFSHLPPAAGKVFQVHERGWGPAEGYPPVLLPRCQGLDPRPAVYQVCAGISPPRLRRLRGGWEMGSRMAHPTASPTAVWCWWAWAWRISSALFVKLPRR